MVIVARCKNCGGKRALFDIPARNVCTYCSDGELEVVVKDPFEKTSELTDVDGMLNYEKIWRLARRASPRICKRVMEKEDLPSETASWQEDRLSFEKKLSEGPDHSEMYGKRLAIFAAALCKAAGREPKEERIWRVVTHEGYRKFLLDEGYRKFLLDQVSSPRMKTALRLQNRQDLAKAVKIFWGEWEGYEKRNCDGLLGAFARVSIPV
ncbi:hypothetical protein AKJ39_01365 [candidate division MSBL1 archaeon SCGC-AAA259J03]|uniref:Uncharacterized protein n=1 Tax=candidate division MSBL1 archaeon SCGC-AAA259J03 TaxID=1698269 RepID=A0A656YX34_9EURY|nr:hypothetical protein AKJ39_01365 [candidate division MSBL1 archaeon SCGC-AAA259J03]